jgi:periplasmic divalent cation tolerance protein
VENARAISLVLTSWPAEGDADAAARQLVDEGLAACVMVGATSTSYYRWEGKRERAEERPLTIKTTRDQVAAVESRLKALHPYELPECVVVDGQASAPYGAWVAESVGPRS